MTFGQKIPMCPLIWWESPISGANQCPLLCDFWLCCSPRGTRRTFLVSLLASAISFVSMESSPKDTPTGIFWQLSCTMQHNHWGKSFFIVKQRGMFISYKLCTANAIPRVNTVTICLLCCCLSAKSEALIVAAIDPTRSLCVFLCFWVVCSTLGR